MPAIKSVNSALTLIQKDSSKILELTVGPHKITPGQEIPRAEAQAAPQLGFSLTSDTKYLVICVDIDAPFPGFGVLGPALHWIQPGLEHEQGIDSATRLSSSTPFIVNYAGPAPPPGSAPHRYIFLLYEQPADFDSKKYAPAGGENVGIWKRMRYDLAAFEKEAKLGPVIAANYFRSK